MFSFSRLELGISLNKLLLAAITLPYREIDSFPAIEAVAEAEVVRIRVRHHELPGVLEQAAHRDLYQRNKLHNPKKKQQQMRVLVDLPTAA